MDLDKNITLYNRMKAAVHRTSPELVQDFENVMRAYTGSPMVLTDFLDTFGSWDPYVASRNARLRRAIFSTPKEKRKTGGHGRSASGHVLVDQQFLFTSDANPAYVWIAGSQAATKIRQTFGTDDQKEALTPTGHEKIKKRRKKELEDAHHDFPRTLDEILDDPSKAKDVQSRNDRHKVHALLGLNEALQERIRMLDFFDYGETAFQQEPAPSYFLAAELGGTLLGRLKRNFDSLPDHIKNAFATITNPLTELDEEERRQIMGHLRLYAIMTTHIRCQSAIEGFQKDLDYILMPENELIRAKYGTPQVAQLRHIFNREEITLIEATQVFNAYRFDKVRQEINVDYLRTYEAELSGILEKLKPLFIEGNTWREDSYNAAVPMGRLQKTMYAAALSRDDFAAVRDVLRLQTMSGKRYVRSMDMQEFRKKIGAAVVAARKVAYMEQVLSERGETIANPADCLDFVERFKHAFYRNADVDLVENFRLEHGIDAHELIKRTEGYHPHNVEWSKTKDRFKNVVARGLYKREHANMLATCITVAKDLVPGEEVRKYYADAKSALEHPLVIPGHLVRLPWEGAEYYRKRELDLVQAIASVQGKIHEQSISAGEEYADKVDIARTLRSTWLVEGDITSHNKLSMGPYSFSSDALIDLGPAKMIRVDHIDAEKAKFEKGYEALSTIGPSRMRKLTYLCTSDSHNLLRDAGIPVGPDSYKRDIEHAAKKGYYISSSLMTRVESLYDLLKSNCAGNDEFIGRGKNEWMAGELYDSFWASVRVPESDRLGLLASVSSLRPSKFPGQVETSWYTSKGYLQEVVKKLRSYNDAHGTQLMLDVKPVRQT